MIISLRHTLIFRTITLAIAALAAIAADAFPADFYASESVLSSGRWVKISVDESGLYQIPVATLRSWGFSDPSRVRIYGYGGRTIPNQITESNYVDDLPQVGAELTSAGLVFYAAGPESWVKSTGDNYRCDNSIYTTSGFYFLTESDAEASEMPSTGLGGGSSPVATACGRLRYEKDLVLAGEAGPLFVGDDLRSQSMRSYTFSTPGRVAGSDVWVETQVVHSHLGSTAELEQSVDETVFKDNVPATTDSHYIHGSLLTARHSWNPAQTDRFVLSLTYRPKRNSYTANLDYIAVNYTCHLALEGNGSMRFWSSDPRLAFEAGADLRIWDVTSPENVEKVNAAFEGGRHVWSVSRTGLREYVAWTPGAALPCPALVGTVANQNLHAATAAVDMIIVAPAAFTAVGQRLASIHAATDGLKAEVVDPALIYNEFSSGCPDVSGLRKYLKMRYDRSIAAGKPLRYVVLLGRSTLDNRAILASTRKFFPNTLPAWGGVTARQSLSDNESYLTDDFIAMLGDNSGSDLGLDDLSVAVGRIPMLSVEEGQSLLDKLENYLTRAPRASWKNRVLVMADDEDQGVHLRQAESMLANMAATPNQQHTFTKVYIDAWPRSNGTVPEARKLMFETLEDGAAWWIFTGHANNHSWTGEGMLTFTDINSLYLKRIPMLLASTCDFLRWDIETISGGEILYKEPSGGTIGMVSATRPVYISDNGYFLNAFGRHALERDDDGYLLTAGEIYRRTKNDIIDGSGRHSSNSNRLRFVFMGDPAMPLVTPSNIVRVETINDETVDGDSQPTMAAMSSSRISGSVTSPDGVVLTDFNGVMFIELYDALHSVTSLANGNGKEEIFDTMGDLLYKGSARVENGRFTAVVPMPPMIADNFREATMSLYARSDADGREAVGCERRFYVYGYEEAPEPDTEAPVISMLALNHEAFEDGATVNSSPVVLATVSDNVAINLSSTGVGHNMTITVDDKIVYSDVATFFTPSADARAAGTVCYELDPLADGPHTLRLRVFDTSGNYAEKSLSFNVDFKAIPLIFDVFTDASPAHTSASFYVRHDRPDDVVDVSVEVSDLMGRTVWTSSVKGMSDMNVSPALTWDLTDRSGRRVARGIYLYRASMVTSTGSVATATRRIAVAAP